MSRFEEIEKRRSEFYEALPRIRVKSIRKLLELYYLSYVEPSIGFQLKRSSENKPRIHPGYKTVMKYLGCNRMSAMDYLYAMYIIENILVKSRVEFLTREKKVHQTPEKEWSRELRPPPERSNP